jgi:predicted helicase
MTAVLAEIARYLSEVDKLYRAGNATEHSYRPALKSLLENITTGLTITNEPKHIACGAPDYIVTKDGTPLGYIEAKDIPVGVDNKQNKEQFDRYRQSLGNLIITNYLEFRLFGDGELVVSVSLARESNGSISPDKKQFPVFLELIGQFTKYSGKTISNSEPLAKMIADKAKLLAAIIKNALKEKSEHDTLSGQYEGFKEILIHNLEINAFADIYAQTLAYGLFAARLNQSTEQQFSRLLAAQLIPQSNPFLRKFFQYIAGFDLDTRICWIVDALADLFNCVSVEDIKKEFEKANQDPYIHFYETFLAEYDPALRETRGVYYTPLPVVKFIVEAVDDILKSEFNLQKGLADYSKVKRIVPGKNGTPETVELHKVQILDPAAGTGTFLAEVIDVIYAYFAKNKGAWLGYCDKHLIPRINGFEILMASYAMAHFKLDMKLRETGYAFKDSSRLRVYLTNSLEEPDDKEQPRFPMIEWLTQEAGEARKVKRDTPVMVVLGNPPYNISTQNKNDWIDNLLSGYKKEPGTDDKLKEQKLNLDDDYVKFIRYGQWFVEKNETGILAYINNHSFLDNPTFRGMRYNLLNTFDKLYILDLHGNVRKRETGEDGGKDENVFDIQQGVSINIFIKTGAKETGASAEVFHYDLYGIRKAKYQYLLANTLSTVPWEKIKPEFPYYFFVKKDFGKKAEYENGFGVQDLFPVCNSGVKTDRDSLFIDIDRDILENRIKSLLSGAMSNDFIERFNVKDSGSYKLTAAVRNKAFSKENIQKIMYRPFDFRYLYYQPSLTSRPAYNVMRHFIAGRNTGLVAARQFGGKKHFIAFITKTLIEISSQPFAPYTVFPLYLYPDSGDLDRTAQRRPNLNPSIVEEIAVKTGLSFTAEKGDDEKTFAPIDILDYIYAVLYSNNYRTKYQEFLKIDFPRVPYPKNAEQFQKLASIGSLLRNLHLLENVTPIMDIADFPVVGTNEVETVNYKAGNVYINKQQYFENITPEVWEYYIGGYQPTEKWLKDRKGRVLSFEDIEHYQKIISVLKTTIELQAQIDEVLLF